MPSFSGDLSAFKSWPSRAIATVVVACFVTAFGGAVAVAGVRDPAGPAGQSAAGVTQYTVDLCRNHADVADQAPDLDVQLGPTTSGFPVMGSTDCVANNNAKLSWAFATGSELATQGGTGVAGAIRVDPPMGTSIASADIWRRLQANPRNYWAPSIAALVGTAGRSAGSGYRDQYNWSQAPLEGCIRPSQIGELDTSGVCAIGQDSSAPTTINSPAYKHVDLAGQGIGGLAWVTGCTDPRTFSTQASTHVAPRCDWHSTYGYTDQTGGYQWQGGPAGFRGLAAIRERIYPSRYGAEWGTAFEAYDDAVKNFGNATASVQLRRMRLLIEDSEKPTSSEYGLLASHRPEYYVNSSTPRLSDSWTVTDNTGVKGINTVSCASLRPDCADLSRWQLSVQPGSSQSCNYMRLRPCPPSLSGTTGVDPSRLVEGEHRVKTRFTTGSGEESATNNADVRVDNTPPNPPAPHAVTVNASQPSVTVSWLNLAQRRGEYSPLWWLGAQRCSEANTDASCVAPVAQAGNPYPASFFSVQQVANGLVVPVPNAPRRGTLRFYLADSAGAHYGGVGNLGDYVAVKYDLDVDGPVTKPELIDQKPVPWIAKPDRHVIDQFKPVDPNRPQIVDVKPFDPVDPNRPVVANELQILGPGKDSNGSGTVPDRGTATGSGSDGRDGKCDPYDGKLASGVRIIKISQRGRGRRSKLLVRGSVRASGTGTVSMRINARRGLSKLRKKVRVAKVTRTGMFTASFPLRARLKARDIATLTARYSGDKKFRTENLFVGVARKVRGKRKAKPVPTYNDPDCWPLAGKSSPAIKITRSSQQRKASARKVRYRILVVGKTDRRLGGRLRVRIKGKGLRSRIAHKTRYVRLKRTGSFSTQIKLPGPLSRRAKLTVEVRYPGDARFSVAVARRAVKVLRR